jgi:2-methylcitrate dehydratase PrpD
MTTVETFAGFAVAFAKKPVPHEVAHHAKRVIIDWYAALLPGAITVPATLLEKAHAEDLDRGRATLALGRRATVRASALINGTAAHAIEFDDIYREAIYHPGAPTIAAALATAQDNGANGEALVKAVVAGYEISTRIGAAMGRAHYKYWHNTGTIGTFGATAAAASILKLDRWQYAHALAISATFAAALQQAYRMDSLCKPLHAGRAAEAGVTAAMMAREGVTGALDVLEAEAGMGRAMSDGPDWMKAVSTLGREFHITRMTVKNHACCGHTFAPIDGALEAQAKLGVKATDIARVRVATYRPALEVAGYDNPTTPAEARFSLKYVVATALTHGSVRLAAFEPERMNDPLTRALLQRIEVVVDPEIDTAFPGRRAARVEIETKDGRLTEYFQPNRKGDPELPLTDKELEGKYLELAAPIIGKVKARSLLEQLWALDHSPTLPTLA